MAARAPLGDLGSAGNRQPNMLLDRVVLCATHCAPNMSSATTSPHLGDDTFENLRLELRRGAVVIAVLARLRTEHYGYELRKALLERGMDIEENTLYPLLRRLETQGLLDSEWREEDKRNKRFYRLAADGQVILARLLEERAEIEASLRRIVEENAL